MIKHPSNKSLLSPVEKLANLHDSLADDAFDAPTEIAEEKNQHARFVASAAIRQGLRTSIIRLGDAPEPLIRQKGIGALLPKRTQRFKDEGKPAAKNRLSRPQATHKEVTSEPKSKE